MVHSQITNYVIVKADSTASHHSSAHCDAKVLTNVFPDRNPTTAILSNTASIKSVKQGRLPFPYLSKNATCTKIFKNLNHSLISLGQLCNNGCSIIINKNILKLTKNNNTIMNGICSASSDNLWDTKLPIYTNNIISIEIQRQIIITIRLQILYYVSNLNSEFLCLSFK